MATESHEPSPRPTRGPGRVPLRLRAAQVLVSLGLLAGLALIFLSDRPGAGALLSTACLMASVFVQLRIFAAERGPEVERG